MLVFGKITLSQRKKWMVDKFRISAGILGRVAGSWRVALKTLTCTITAEVTNK